MEMRIRMGKQKTIDDNLLQALTKTYQARAQLFHNGIKASKIDLLIAEIDNIDHTQLQWDLGNLGISNSAFARVKLSGSLPHQVFAHPEVICNRPHLIAYYRNIVTISKKGIAQILFPTDRYEAKKTDSMEKEDAQKICHTFNTIVSGVIEKISDYTLELSRKAVLAEIGTELQGTWANMIGKGAAKAVENIFKEYIENKNIGTHDKPGIFKLHNGWLIRFGNEPDVAFYDDNSVKQIAIEIKGSLDKAGAQTRYGEAKKSFAKQLSENPRCYTVYLASCFTDAVIQQIQTDGQVREWFNLTSILYDSQEKNRFLRKIFHIVNMPK